VTNFVCTSETAHWKLLTVPVSPFPRFPCYFLSKNHGLAPVAKVFRASMALKGGEYCMSHD
jgi:hypothetical protein